MIPTYVDLKYQEKSIYVGIICYVLSVRGSVRVPQPMEIWFYDDYMILYRPKRIYKKSNIRREFHKFYYKDIHRIEHRTVVDKIVIYGIYEGKYYKYNKNTDIVQDKPSYHRTVDAIDTFYIMFEKNIDFLGLLKNYTGLDIEISHS